MADRINVLRDDQITMTGSPNELVATLGIYADMYAKQASSVEEEKDKALTWYCDWKMNIPKYLLLK